MSFEGIDKILHSLTQQTGWEEYRHYRQILLAWQRSIPSRLQEKTRVVSLSRGVVSVATFSAALAQDLTLQRFNLLKRLNAILEHPVTDIRFSSAQWRGQSPTPPESVFPHSAGQSSITWTRCPICDAPTPETELQRWNCCSFCWSRSPS